jgi:hypothetical protein
MTRSVSLGQRLVRAVAAATLTAVSAFAQPALGHSADPTIGSPNWSPNQTLAWAWAGSQVPPSWLQAPFERATADANASRGSRSGYYVRQSSAPSTVAYGEPTGCSSAGIACFSRNAPYSFRIWFRAHGYRFDWGTLRWCQGPSGFVDGCFDVETIALDELGHVLGLGHHLNYSDDRDYRDAVVQTVSRSRPKAGWDAHAFGRCDVARLQLIYSVFSSWDPVSSCLSIGTVTSLSPSSTSVLAGTEVAMRATVRAASSSSYGALSGIGVSGRTVVLERRVPGAATWTTVATMTPQSGDGNYATTVAITGRYEWRATFRKPSAEGWLGSSSAWIAISTTSCSICPNRVALAGPA